MEEAELVFSENGTVVSKIHKNGDYDNAYGEFLGVAYFSERGARILKEVFYKLKDCYSRNPNKAFQSAKSFEKAYMTDMFQELTDRGYSVNIATIEGTWAEIDTPQDLETVQRVLREKVKVSQDRH